MLPAAADPVIRTRVASLRATEERAAEDRARTERLLLPDLVLLQRIMQASPWQENLPWANLSPARQQGLSNQPAGQERRPAVPLQEAQLPREDGRKLRRR